MAPDAPQRASFQEQRGPDPRTVVDRIAFDVEEKWHLGDGFGKQKYEMYGKPQN
jgi:hypothetical protein